MTCAKAGKALPLFVGRDLDAALAAAVAAHLEACPRCRILETELRESRGWLKSASAPPFDEADCEAVRRRVWREIEARGLAGASASPRTGLLVFAGAGAVAVLAAVLLLRPHAEAPLPVGANAATPRLMVAPPLPASPIEEPSARRPVPAGGRRSRGSVRRAAERVEASVVKIEFQTANPDVRIIWLAKKGGGVPSPLAASPKQEVS